MLQYKSHRFSMLWKSNAKNIYDQIQDIKILYSCYTRADNNLLNGLLLALRPGEMILTLSEEKEKKVKSSPSIPLQFSFWNCPNSSLTFLFILFY